MKNLRRLACKFDLDQSERKSPQVNASPGQTETQVDASFLLYSEFLTIFSLQAGTFVGRSVELSRSIITVVRL